MDQEEISLETLKSAVKDKGAKWTPEVTTIYEINEMYLRRASFQFLKEEPMSGSEIVDKIEEYTEC